MSVSADPRIGTELLGYRLEVFLGRGGMGVVYRAYDARLKRNVALKLLAPELTGDERFRERFLAESELAASLDHPSVIPIYDAGEAEGVLFVAMRYVDGSDLKVRLRSGVLEPERAIAIVGQIAGALDAAHKLGLVHRDVKPSNVLVDRDEHAYLADFGLSRRLGDARSPVGTGVSLGTPAYVAPEQILGGDVDGRADQYALACLLYECLSGEPPYPRSSEAAVLFAHLRDEPPAHSELRDVLARGLAKDPVERYPTCAAFVEAAREALGIAQPTRARWPYLVAGVGAAVLGGAILAVVLLQSGSSPPIRATGNDVAAIDPSSNRVVTVVPVGLRPEGIAFTSGSLWVANLNDHSVAQVDPVAGSVLHTVPVGDLVPNGLAATDNAVWVVGVPLNCPAGACQSLTVSRIDPERDTVTKLTELPGVEYGSPSPPYQGDPIATHENVVWVAPEQGGLVSRLDPRDGRVVRAFDSGSFPAGVAVGADAVWVTDTAAGTVTRVDPTSGHLTTISVGRGPTVIALGAGSVWVADSLAGTVTRIDQRTGHVTQRIGVGRLPLGIAFGAGSVWVANSEDGTVTRIDPADGAVLKTINVGGSPRQVLVAEGRVWVTVQ
jgi:YVTN family beta-propeller protein